MTRFTLTRIVEHGPRVSARLTERERIHAALMSELTPQRIERLVAEAIAEEHYERNQPRELYYQR